MKVIVEKINGTVFCYRETEKVFKHNEKFRLDKSQKLDVFDLANECNISGRPNCYVVIDGNI